AAGLVVGADGLWSIVRHAVGQAREPRFRNYCAWRTTIARDLAPPEMGGNDIGLWLGRQAHVVHYPVAGGRLLNVVVIERDARPVSGWSAPGDGAALARRLADASRSLTALIRAAADWRVWSLYDLDPPRLFRGRL